MQESIFVHIHYGNLMSYLRVLLEEEFRLCKKIYTFHIFEEHRYCILSFTHHPLNSVEINFQLFISKN